MSTFFKVILTFISAIFLFSACANKNDASLMGKEFQLINAPENAQITIGFMKSEAKFAGKAAVNRYFGIYTVDGDNIKFSGVGSTMMMGPENLMKAETEYLQSLAAVKTFKINGKKLILNGSKTLEFEQIGEIKE